LPSDHRSTAEIRSKGERARWHERALTGGPKQSTARGEGELTDGAQGQGRALEPVSGDPGRWIRRGWLGSSARGLTVVVDVASSVTAKLPGPRQAWSPGTLRSPELARTGEGVPGELDGRVPALRTGLGPGNGGKGAPGGSGLLRRVIPGARRGNRVR
jgi:hypothetical protein